MTRRTIYFTSDQHFNHSNIIEFCDRPFENVGEMNAKLIENWNNQVKPHDIVYVLGDFIWNTTPKGLIRELLETLNGEIHLVIGNHDQLTVHQALRLGFKSACYEMKLKIGKRYVKLSHYPYRFGFWKDLKVSLWRKLTFAVWDGVTHLDKRPHNDGGWLLHGHSHQKAKVKGKSIHVGVESWDYKLVSMDKITEIMNKS